MSHDGRDISPPMDVGIEEAEVRKGRGWARSPPSLSNPSAALRADTLLPSRSRRPRSPTPEHTQRDSDSGKSHYATHPKREHKMSRAEALLRTRSATLDVLRSSLVPPTPVSTQGVLGPSPPLKRDDWACAVCSNWNSSERESCFRCSTTYADSLQTVPTSELFLGPIRGFSVDDVKQALVEQLQSVGVELPLGDLRAAATPTGAFCYVEMPDVPTASKAVALLCCSLRLGADAPPCAVKFSQERYVRRYGRSATSDPSSANLSAGAVPSSAPTPALPPTLASPRWTAPPAFESPTAEKDYLRVMSEHWDALSTAQKAFYDERVRLALQSHSAHASEVAATDASTGTPDKTEERQRTNSPKVALASDASASATVASESADSTSAVSSLKQRLALRKAAKAAGTASTTSPSSTTPPSPSPSSLSVGLAGPAPLSPTTDAPEEVVHLFCGIPIPPSLCHRDGVRLPTRLVLTGIPVYIAEHLLPPHLLNM